MSRTALVAADIASIDSYDDLKTVIDVVTRTIVEWNVSKQYKANADDKRKNGNCQHFVETILHLLGHKIQFEGPLKRFWSKLREKGSGSLKFKMTDPFRHAFKLDEKSKKFQTHYELDAFVKHLESIDIDFRTKYKDEYAFLKAIDRGFWIRYFKAREMLKKCEFEMQVLSQMRNNSKNSDQMLKLQQKMSDLNSARTLILADIKLVKPCVKQITNEDNQPDEDIDCPLGDPLCSNSMIFV